MIKLAILFFIVSLVAGVLGFTNVAAGARGIAKILFFIALTIFLIVVSVIFIRNQVRPIEKLADAMERFGRGV